MGRAVSIKLVVDGFHAIETEAERFDCVSAANENVGLIQLTRARATYTIDTFTDAPTSLLPTPWTTLCGTRDKVGIHVVSHLDQGRNHVWKVEGGQGLGPNTGALAPHNRPKASPCWVREGPGVSLPENFWKLRC